MAVDPDGGRAEESLRLRRAGVLDTHELDGGVLGAAGVQESTKVREQRLVVGAAVEEEHLDLHAAPPPRTVRQDCQVMRRITSVIARPISGSAMSSPIATTAALATTARLT